jgi:hypothetical protein
MAATLVPDAALALTRPLADVSAWAAHFLATEVPILAETSQALEDMRAREDDVDAHMLAGAITGDPLMTLKVLAHAGLHRPERLVTDTETVTATLVLMGISPFFRARRRNAPRALAGRLRRPGCRRAARTSSGPLRSRLCRASHGQRRASHPPGRSAA